MVAYVDTLGNDYNRSWQWYVSPSICGPASSYWLRLRCSNGGTELMFKNSRFLSPAQNDAREDMAQATLVAIHGMPVVKSYRQVDAVAFSSTLRIRTFCEKFLNRILLSNPFNALFLFADITQC